MLGITYIPDFLRGVRSFPHGFMDLVREPIHQGANIDIGKPLGSKKAYTVLSGFDVDTFRALAGITPEIFADRAARQLHWSNTYFNISKSAINYLFDHIPQNHLLLSFEIPHWLAQACTARGIDFLDLRVSPLRFGRDLYIGLRSSNTKLFQRISACRVSEEELRMEASLLSANIRMHRARLEDDRGFNFENLDGALLFVGQAPYDASLLAMGGKSLRCTDFADELRDLCKGRQLVYKGHPFAPDFSHEERITLEKITGQSPASCLQNAYQILSSEDDVALAGISSGLLQEATWFQKTAHTLYQSFVPLTLNGQASLNAYQQIHFQSLLSPAFWHQVLAPERPTPRLVHLPSLPHHHAREILDQWWDYSKVMTWERSFPFESFMRGGGAVLRDKFNELALATGNISNNLNISADTENKISIAPSAKVTGNIKISGKKNQINIEEGAVFEGNLEINGEGNVFTIEKYSRIKGKFFLEGCESYIHIDRNTSFEDVTIVCAEDCNVKVGKDCMFSRRVEIRTTDAHSIVNLENGMRTNLAKDIVIGNHVWIDTDCLVLKNSKIPDNCVIGARSVVNQSFSIQGSLIVGSPAKIVKEKITWHRERKEQFTENEISSWQGPGIDSLPSWR